MCSLRLEIVVSIFIFHHGTMVCLLEVSLLLDCMVCMLLLSKFQADGLGLCYAQRIPGNVFTNSYYE